MADTAPTLSSTSMSTTSYNTALCIIPPQDQCLDVDKLRSLYDKGFERWPPHINLVYPFVAPESLAKAKGQIDSFLGSHLDDREAFRVDLDQSGYFKHRNNSTVYLCESVDSSSSPLARLRSAVLCAVGQEPSLCNFHLTVGQSEDESESTRGFLLSKARLLPVLTFGIGSLAILVRERDAGPDGRMRLWDTIDLPNSQPSSGIPIPEFWLRNEETALEQPGFEDEEKSELAPFSQFSRLVQPGTTYQFNLDTDAWTLAPFSTSQKSIMDSLSISSYNVLIDSEYPPARDRDSMLVATLLSDAALADVLILQEVSDDFLSFLLADEAIQQRYPYSSHGPPSQPDIGPLPSLRNVVILAKHHFRWEFVPFHRRHKGAVVATFSSIVEASLPLVVAGVHLTCGLTDGSVAAKKVQLNNLMNHLKRHYPANPWIIAGDFNITTSRYTIDEAVKNKEVSQQTVRTLESMEINMSEAGLLDTWAVARVGGADESEDVDVNDLFEGEEGATFNPRENTLAAATSGTSWNRPQRYDRILMRPQGILHVSRFHHFGLPKTIDGITSVPSDHSGIHAALTVRNNPHQILVENSDLLKRFPIQHRGAAPHLSRTHDLQETLTRRSVFPTSEQAQSYSDALALMKRIILGSSDDLESNTSDVPMVIVPVGSYALGVWTATSDIDCLCIGPISSKTFFRLAIQRLHKAQSQGVRLLRRVRANTGTMLELSVKGVNMDLQYCPAANIVQK
jgi:endonuclease/exonuclease/phosphatase family metal-dependent hydrolase